MCVCCCMYKLTLQALTLGNSISFLGDDSVVGRENILEMLHIRGYCTDDRWFLWIRVAVASVVMLCYLIYSFIIAGGQECILVKNEGSACARTQMVSKLQLSTVRVARKYFFFVNLMSAWKIWLVNWCKMFCFKSLNQNIKLHFFVSIYLNQIVVWSWVLFKSL